MLGGVGVLLGYWTSPAVAQVAAAKEVDDRAADEPEYPTAYVDRPLTLPAFMAEASVVSRYWSVDDDEDVSTSRVTAIVGLTDWWQASATTRWSLAPERAWGEVVTMGSRVQALDTARVDVAPGVGVGMLFDGDRDTEAISSVTVDGRTRIRILRRSALYIGHDLVTFGLAGDRSASVDLNAAIVFQHGEHLATRASAQLMHIEVYGDGRGSGGPNFFGVTTIVSPAWWIDLWAGFELSGSGNDVLGGVAGRL